MYQDMSFLQSMETSELVDVVADFSTDDLTRITPEQQQQKFAGKMIKGKVSPISMDCIHVSWRADSCGASL